MRSSGEQHYIQTLKISHNVTTAFSFLFLKSLQNDNLNNNNGRNCAHFEFDISGEPRLSMEGSPFPCGQDELVFTCQT